MKKKVEIGLRSRYTDIIGTIESPVGLFVASGRKAVR
jgi:hypothetical protein